MFLVSCCLLLAVGDFKLPFGAWNRASQTPILSPQGDGWESAGTFNPAVVMHDGKFVMLYRAQDDRAPRGSDTPKAPTAFTSRAVPSRCSRQKPITKKTEASRTLGW